MAHAPLDPDIMKKAAGIHLLVLDVDGVLTDGSITYDHRGRQIQTFHVHDGMGIRLLQNAGILTAIISARSSSALEKRALELGIDRVFQGKSSKTDAFMSIMNEFSIHPHEAAYIGDDLVDIPVMKLSGFAVAVANARPEVKAVAHYTTNTPGGSGAVREVCEIILRATGMFERMVAGFSDS